MRYRTAMATAAAALILALGAAAPASAGDGPAAQAPDPLTRIEPLLDPNVLLQGVVREEDVTLLFAHLRAALLASYQGREPPPPEAINRRMEAIGAELRARGVIAGLVALTAFEAAARQALREALAVPGSAPR